ncbi:MAG: TetR/AcrR family transcriptional regulator [Anaerolineales bacterium]|nr:TetR/AcrR family transcriptional regulator [Anaerolineales bacterium]
MSSDNYHHGNLKNALIKAGMEILEKKGTGGLSLRSVAKQAGVSHAAPYAHFADKQALIAAISTEGFKRLLDKLEIVRKMNANDPPALLVEISWAYIRFAQQEPDCFKLMFSSALEKEKEYSDFVKVSQQNFRQLVDVVEVCQQAGILEAGPADQIAVSVWGTVHGLIMLMLEGQVPHSVLEKYPLRKLLLFSLNQIAVNELTE